MSADASVETEREIFLRSLSLVPPPESLVREFTRIVRDLEFPAGAVLFAGGAPSGDLYFIVRGRVELTAPGLPSWILDEGSVIGLFDAIQEREHARTARAVSSVRALVVNSASYFELLEDDFDFARALVSAVPSATWLKALELGARAELGPLSEAAQDGAPAPRPDNLVDAIQLLVDTEPFSQLPTQALVLLGLAAKVVEVPAGSRLYEAGAPRDALYVVASGRVRLMHETLSAEFGPHTLVGGFGAFADQSVVFGAEALEPTTTLAIHVEDLLDVTEEHFAVVRGFMRYNSICRERLMNVVAIAGPHPFRTPA